MPEVHKPQQRPRPQLRSWHERCLGKHESGNVKFNFRPKIVCAGTQFIPLPDHRTARLARRLTPRPVRDVTRPVPRPGRALRKMSRSTIPSKRSADAQEDAWVADEDRFVLQQSKKKAAIRAKAGRAQPIDWLAVTLAVIDPERNPLGDEVDPNELETVNPEAVFDGLDDAQLTDLEKSIETYITLEKSKSNHDYWAVSVCHAATMRSLY